MLENKIKNEIAKRIDKTHLYSFNLANYKSNLSESQLADWKEALKKIESNGACTLDEKYKRLYSADAKKSITYLASLNPSNALEADIAREYLTNLEEKELTEVKELNTVNEIFRNGAKYPIVKHKDYLILNENKIKPFKITDRTFITLGVSNVLQENFKTEIRKHFTDDTKIYKYASNTGMLSYVAYWGFRFVF